MECESCVGCVDGLRFFGSFFIQLFLILINFNVGVWRSWLARTHGVREAAGSSPVTPTREVRISPQVVYGLFLFVTGRE